MEILFDTYIPVKTKGRRKTEEALYSIYTSGDRIYFSLIDEDGGHDVTLEDLVSGEVYVDEARALKAELNMKTSELLATKQEARDMEARLREEIFFLEAKIPKGKLV